MSSSDSNEAHELLQELGLSIRQGGVEMVNFDFEGKSYIHHTQMPVAIAGHAQASLTGAFSKFPKTTLLELVRKRPSMDNREVMAFALVCGVEVSPPFWNNPDPFLRHLLDVVSRYELWGFFEMADQPEGRGLIGFRPRGFDWSIPDWPQIPGVIEKWRRDYRAMPTEKQMMVATIMQLYTQREEEIWMVRVPKKWHAAEAVMTLRDAGCLQDWAKLIALYPGW